jgi:hypothetical protein
LFGLSEWRDLSVDYPGTGDDRRWGKEVGALPREICILPFPYDEVLLQGETKQLRLYEDRFIQLFDTCMNEHCGVVAMGLIATAGIIQTVPIAEIEDYNRQLDGFGIFVTIRVVGRAKLFDIVQQTPYIKAVCTEITDTIPPNLDLYVNQYCFDVKNGQCKCFHGIVPLTRTHYFLVYHTDHAYWRVILKLQ